MVGPLGDADFAAMTTYAQILDNVRLEVRITGRQDQRMVATRVTTPDLPGDTEALAALIATEIELAFQNREAPPPGTVPNLSPAP